MFVLLILTMFGALATARPPFWQTYRSVYGIQDGTDAGKAQCRVCHIQPPQLGTFGKVVQAQLHALGKSRVDLEVLRSVEAADSDGDGVSNGDEMRAGTLPGDPVSKPGAALKGDAPPRSPFDALIPSHWFHPVFVHFPIALVVFGAALEALGWRRRDPRMRHAGFLNLGVAALLIVPAAITGFLAAWRNGQRYEGATLLHVVLSLAAVALVAAVALWRRREPRVGAGYWLLLLLAVAATVAAGHIGGALVYG